jgi:hypothetical protein
MDSADLGNQTILVIQLLGWITVIIMFIQGMRENKEQ